MLDFGAAASQFGNPRRLRTIERAR